MKVSECVNENFQRVNEREENEGGYTLSEEVAAREPLRIVRAWRCESADAVEAARPIRTGMTSNLNGSDITLPAIILEKMTQD